MCTILPFRGWHDQPAHEMTWDERSYSHLASDEVVTGGTRERWWIAHGREHSYEVHFTGGNSAYRLYIVTERNGSVDARKVGTFDTCHLAKLYAERYERGEAQHTLFEMP